MSNLLTYHNAYIGRRRLREPVWVVRRRRARMSNLLTYHNLRWVFADDAVACAAVVGGAFDDRGVGVADRRDVKRFIAGFGQYLTAADGFESGKVAMMYDGEWNIAYAAENVPSLKVGAAPFPAPAAHPELSGTSYIDTNPLCIPAGASHPQEAFQFIKWLGSNPQVSSEYATLVINLPQLAALAPDQVRVAPVPAAQPLDRDIAVVVDSVTPVGELMRVLRANAGRATIGAHQLPRTLQNVSAVDLVVERVEPSPGIGLGRPVERSLQFSDFVLPGGPSHDVALTGPSLCVTHERSSGPSLTAGSVVPSAQAVLRPPPTPTRHAIHFPAHHRL